MRAAAVLTCSWWRAAAAVAADQVEVEAEAEGPTFPVRLHDSNGPINRHHRALISFLTPQVTLFTLTMKSTLSSALVSFSAMSARPALGHVYDSWRVRPQVVPAGQDNVVAETVSAPTTPEQMAAIRSLAHSAQSAEAAGAVICPR